MRVGILGGGQLARMLAIAAHRIGVEPWVVDPKPEAPAAPVAHHVLSALDDAAGLRALQECDVVTAELDHAPARVLKRLAAHVPVRPGPAAFACAGDRLREKTLFRRLDVPTPPCVPIEAPSELADALRVTGLPAVLKTRREGYDGKGQRIVHSQEEARRAFAELGAVPALLESKVAFAREVSFLAVRGLDREVRFWSPVENHHEGGILRRSRPCEDDLDLDLADQGRRATRAVLEALDYVGVLAVEFFEADGVLLANEMACRVHNSGHWTEEGAETSQFENHLRAILGLPLGGTGTLGPTAMLNLIGELPPRGALAELPGARVHLYGKAPAPDRKLGHVTLRVRRAGELDAALRDADLWMASR